MENQNGPVLIVLSAHVQKILLGWVKWSMLITCILGQSARTKDPATEPQEHAIASLDMTASLVNVLCAQTTAMIVAHAGLKNILLPKPDAHTPLLGTP